MQNDFAESLRVNLKTTRNIYMTREKNEPNLKVYITKEEISKNIQQIESGIVCDKKKLKKLHLLIVDDQISSGKNNVGFGMDYREKYRELPYITNVRKEDLSRSKLYMCQI